MIFVGIHEKEKEGKKEREMMLDKVQQILIMIFVGIHKKRKEGKREREMTLNDLSLWTMDKCVTIGKGGK